MPIQICSPVFFADELVRRFRQSKISILRQKYSSSFIFRNRFMPYCKHVLYAKYRTASLHDQNLS